MTSPLRLVIDPIPHTLREYVTQGGRPKGRSSTPLLGSKVASYLVAFWQGFALTSPLRPIINHTPHRLHLSYRGVQGKLHPLARAMQVLVVFGESTLTKYSR